MAYLTLDATNGHDDLEISSAEYVLRTISDSKRALLSRANAQPGLKYYFDGLQLKWEISDVDLYRAFLNRQKFPKETIDLKVAQVRSYPVAIDFGPLHDRLLQFKLIFDENCGYSQPSCKAELALTFDTALQAGAQFVGRSDAAITVASGLFNLARWFTVRQLFDVYYPAFIPSPVSRSISLTPQDQWVLINIVNALKVFSHNIVHCSFKYVSEEIGNANSALAFMTHVEEGILRDQFTGTSFVRRSEWRSAEAFVLCHEFGHINLGHLDEAREWAKRSPSSTREAESRRARRREMEHEADSYALANMVMLMSCTLGKSHTNLVEAERDPNSERDFILPVVDLFTILELGQMYVVDFADPKCSYPGNRDRLRYLLAKHDGNPPHVIERIMTQMTCVCDAPVFKEWD